ncbi:hypothetical protein [Anaerotignum lactatifermentans]|nr:hypothetical protein [Anaerotignum lactatifermentans]
MIQLRTFQPEDAEKIISWVDSPLVFYQWCAGFLGDLSHYSGKSAAVL